MIHVIIWHVEQCLGEWELRNTRQRAVIAKNIIVRGGEPLPFSPFTQHERWSFHVLPALGAEVRCTRLVWSICHTHANCLSAGCQRCWQDGEKERPQIIPPLMEENVRGISACLQLFRLPSKDCLLYIAHLNLALRNQDDVIVMPSQARGS